MRTSTQEVLPPYRRFSAWGVGVEPLTPQNLTSMGQSSSEDTPAPSFVGMALCSQKVAEVYDKNAVSPSVPARYCPALPIGYGSNHPGSQAEIYFPASSTARSSAWALLRHSWYSASGTESTTMPAPACTYAFLPRMTRV